MWESARVKGMAKAVGVGVIGCLMSISLDITPTYAQTQSAPTASATSSAPVILNQTGPLHEVKGIHDSAWPSIVSQAAVVMDMSTGTVVYDKAPLAQHYPASITKIMTALLALKLGHLTDTLTASQNAVNQPPDKLYLVPGEQEQLKPLLYAMLLDSANDVAVEVAEHYGGSVAHFATMMNAQAKALGATHTHFDNPNGLPDPNHVTTAYDMALIARAAMQYPEFRKIVDTKYFNWQGKAWHARLSNLNSMLFYYPGTIGVKTGFTSVAHETLVVAVHRGPTTFLAVLMDTPTDYEIRHDASQLLDYAFAHYTTQTIYAKGQVVGSLPGKTANTPIQTGQAVLATVEQNHPLQVHATLTYALPNGLSPKGTKVATLQLTDASGKTSRRIPVVLGRDWQPIDVHSSARPWPVIVGLVVVCTAVLLGLRKLARRRKGSVQTQNTKTTPPSYGSRFI